MPLVMLAADAYPDTEWFNVGSPSEQVGVDMVSGGGFIANILTPLFNSSRAINTVYFEGGFNDGWIGTPLTPAQIFSNPALGTGVMEQFLAAAKRIGFKRMVASSDAGSGVASNPNDASMDQLGQNIQAGWQTCAEALVDYKSSFIVGLKGSNLDTKVFSDGIHQNTLGSTLEFAFFCKGYEKILAAAPVNSGSGVFARQ
jgi:hypothetical protein